MIRKISVLFLLITSCLHLQLSSQIPREVFEFKFEGFVLNGILNVPEVEEPKALVIIVHGSGQTQAVANEWHHDVRAQFIKSGYAVYMWDKMGCGKSEGKFDYNQPVQNSAEEVIAAINTLKNHGVPGSHAIGLWGISRAGWINPLVIKQYKDIKFWISVSGTDDKENFGYLLRENLRIAGTPHDSIDLIVEEWKRGNEICHQGGTYEAYLDATTHIRKHPFIIRFSNGEGNEAGYYQWQKTFMKQDWDSVSRLAQYVPDFEEVLSTVHCPVLALFGEKDMNVDWKKTKALYQKTLGQHTDLSIQSFPNCNHNIFSCKHGGLYEIQDDELGWNRCPGYLDAIASWLDEIE